MNKKAFTLLLSAVLLLSPISIMALNSLPQPGDNLSIATALDNIAGFIWGLFLTFAIIMFIVAGFLFLIARGDPGKVKEARNAVLWGAIGIAVGFLAFSFPYLVKMLLGV